MDCRLIINPSINRALATWGEQAQMMMVVEKMSELTKEILKNVGLHKDNLDAIMKETADVEIMLAQLKENYRIADRVEAYKENKIKLIERRLNEWDEKAKG